MSLLAAVVRVETTERVPGWLGRAAQAWLLDQVQQADPALAAWVHGGKDHDQQAARRPYTVSAPRYDGEGCWLRFTSTNADLSAVMVDRILPQLDVIQLAGIALKVHSIATDAHEWAGTSTFEELAQSAFAGVPDKPAAFEFATPTAFHSGGLSVPLPLPGLIYGSLVLAWNTASPVPLPVNVGEFVEQCVGMAKHRIATRMVNISAKERQVGFIGTAQTMIMPQEKSGFTPDDYRLRVQTLDLLARFAFYVGIGVRTTVGMGQTRRLPDVTVQK